jgi:hypothetical protein
LFWSFKLTNDTHYVGYTNLFKCKILRMGKTLLILFAFVFSIISSSIAFCFSWRRMNELIVLALAKISSSSGNTNLFKSTKDYACYPPTLDILIKCIKHLHRSPKPTFCTFNFVYIRRDWVVNKYLNFITQIFLRSKSFYLFQPMPIIYYLYNLIMF